MTSLTGSSTNLSTPKGLPLPAEPRRLYELDSLRGLAALSVVLLHLTNFWSDENFKSFFAAHKIVRFLVVPFFAGHEAVIFFFILSGFVLSLPRISRRPQSYRIFITRRIFRIYFPYLCALGLAIACNAFCASNVAWNVPLQGQWNAPVQLKPVLQHIAFIGTYNTDTFNVPIWSLVHEMRISIIFPALCWIVLSIRPSKSLLLAASLSLSAACLAITLKSHFSYLLTIDYSAFFVLGICLAANSSAIHNLFVRLTRHLKFFLFLLALLLYWYPRGMLVEKIPLDRLPLASAIAWDWPTAIGASLLIVLSLNATALRTLLRTKPVIWLGEMSYSLYLTHFIVLLTFAHLPIGKLNLFVVLILCLSSTLIFARVFFLAVERPFMNMGRRLTRKPETLQAPKQSSP